MQWKPVDLGTISRILDLMSVDPSAVETPGLIYDMLDAKPIPDPDNPAIDANAARVLAGLLRMGSLVVDPAASLTACLQYPLPDPTHGG